MEDRPLQELLAQHAGGPGGPHPGAGATLDPGVPCAEVVKDPGLNMLLLLGRNAYPIDPLILTAQASHRIILSVCSLALVHRKETNTPGCVTNAPKEQSVNTISDRIT